MRLIDADALQKQFDEKCIHDCEFCPFYLRWVSEELEEEGCCVFIQRATTIEAEPVRHAYWMGWEYDGYADGFPVFESWLCSECGEGFRSEGDPPAFDYCPRCGARMDGDPDG